jgi:hypothetical protein
MKKDSKRCVVELDGSTYFCSGNRIEKIIDLKDVSGGAWVISDMQGTIVKSMTVDAEYRYAEHVVRRKLQETGEFEEAFSLITHLKKKKSKNVTEIFFSAVPTRIYQSYIDKIVEYSDSIVLLPLYSFIFGVIKKMNLSRPVAMVFQHGRFADMIIGTGDSIYYANRCVAFDTNEKQVSGLWDTIQSDIAATEEENRVKVESTLLINWVTCPDLSGWVTTSQRPVRFLEEEEISMDGRIHNISLLKALEKQSAGGSIAPTMEKVFYHAGKYAPILNFLIVLMFLAFAGGYFWFQERGERLQDYVTRLRARVD